MNVEDSTKDDMDVEYSTKDDMNVTDDIKEEYYTIDSNKEGIVIYGGNKHEIFVNNIKDNEIINIFNDFSDSVIYVKYINNTTFYAVSLNGEVGIYNISTGLIEITELEEEITSHSFSKINENTNSLILGSVTGTIYNFFDGIKYKCYYGHTNEIFQAEYLDEQIYSLSADKFIIFDVETTKNEYTMESYLLTSFFLVSSTVFLIASEKNLRIYKNNRLLKKVDNLFSSFVKTNDGVICGGEKLIEIGFNNGISIFDFQIQCEKVIHMKIYANELYFTDGKNIAIGDIRQGNFEWIELDLGEIFDFMVYTNSLNEEIKKILIVGENGLSVLKL